MFLTLFALDVVVDDVVVNVGQQLWLTGRAYLIFKRLRVQSLLDATS